MSNAHKVIVALDQMSLEEIDRFLKRTDNTLSFVKIGLELYLKYGPEFVMKVNKEYKKRIFLDLKLHDIPVTVNRAIHSLRGLPIDFLTVHLSGGQEMLKAARNARDEVIPQCKILGVSFLTSLEEEDLDQMFGIKDANEAFLRLFKLAHISGIDGVVSSPLEVSLLKRNYPKLLSVTPGIRFQDEIDQAKTQDQKRVMSPENAFMNGCDYLVIGRSLTKASNLSERLELI